MWKGGSRTLAVVTSGKVPDNVAVSPGAMSLKLMKAFSCNPTTQVREHAESPALHNRPETRLIPVRVICPKLKQTGQDVGEGIDNDQTASFNAHTIASENRRATRLKERDNMPLNHSPLTSSGFRKIEPFQQQ